MRPPVSPHSNVFRNASQSLPTPISAITPGFHHEMEKVVVKEPRKRRRRKKIITEEERLVKHTAFLERNRQAALKCRSKRKNWLVGLEDEARAVKEQNGELKKEFRELLEEVLLLRSQLAGCGCDFKNEDSGKHLHNGLDENERNVEEGKKNATTDIHNSRNFVS